MKKWLPILTLFFSCGTKSKNKFANIVHKTDRLQVTYTSGAYKDTSIVFGSESRKIFLEIFESSEERCKCFVSGRLRFYSKNVVVLVADFAVQEKGIDEQKDCEYLFVVPGEGSCYKLSYHAGIYLNSMR